MSFGSREAPAAQHSSARWHSKQGRTSVQRSGSRLHLANARRATGVECPKLPRRQASLFKEPIVLCHVRRTGYRAKNSRPQFLPQQPALRAHSRKPNLHPAKPVLIMSNTVPLRMPRSSTVAPNPSIEGMPKRLRLLCTPHVKRWAS
jgi:hypothetical protein